MLEKLPVIANKRFGKRKKPETNIAANDPYDASLRSIRLSGVCGWSSWLITSLSTFSAVFACFGLPLSCLWSVLPVSLNLF